MARCPLRVRTHLGSWPAKDGVTWEVEILETDLASSLATRQYCGGHHVGPGAGPWVDAAWVAPASRDLIQLRVCQLDRSGRILVPDRVSRGWSLHLGFSLCELPCPSSTDDPHPSPSPHHRRRRGTIGADAGVPLEPQARASSRLRPPGPVQRYSRTGATIWTTEKPDGERN